MLVKKTKVIENWDQIARAEVKRRKGKARAFENPQKRQEKTEGNIRIFMDVLLYGIPRAKEFRTRQPQVDRTVLMLTLWITTDLQ